jgi:acyl carrier protein
MTMMRPQILKHLLNRCVEDGLFVQDVPIDPSADMIESGQIDSMGLLALQSLIEETYSVVIPEAIFVGELRNLERVADYLEEMLSTWSVRRIKLLVGEHGVGA